MKNNIDYPPLEVFCTTYFDELQNREKILCTDENLKHLKKEKTNGVYVLYNANDELIYAGESKNIFDRIYNDTAFFLDMSFTVVNLHFSGVFSRGIKV